MPRPSKQVPRLVSAGLANPLSEFEQLLVSNAGEDAFDIALQLLTAKLFDESEEREGKAYEHFGIGLKNIEGKPSAVHEGIQALYRRALQKWPDLDTGRTSIDISPEQLIRCLRPLLGLRILHSDLSHLDAVLERLVAKDAKAALGQYFTPRDIIRMCVRALNARPMDRIIDPACGSGAFLYEAIQYARSSGQALPRCLGIDLGQRSVRVAMLLSHALEPGALTIHRGNSIDGRAYKNTEPKEWQPFLEEAPSAHQNQKQAWGAWHRLQCDLLLTNPPFAGEIDDPEIIAAYDSQRSRAASSKSSVGREQLFVERSLKLLAPGGRMAIVVPQGILANPSAAYLRKWLISQCRVLAVVGLHPHAFLPYTGVKTALLFLERPALGESLPKDYPMAFITSREPGKDSSGRALGRSDYAQIAEHLSDFFYRERRPWAKPSVQAHKSPLETIKLSEARAHDRLDAEYHAHDIRSLYLEIRAKAKGTLGDKVEHSLQRFSRAKLKEPKEPDQPKEIDYLDISSVDPRSGLALPKRIEASEAPSRAGFLACPGDVLVSTVRPDRNAVALITKSAEVPLVASNGFCLLRPQGIPPELLFAFCKTNTFRKLLSRRAAASMYPAATDRDVFEMPFVEPSGEAAASIVGKIQKGLEMMEEARASIASAIAEMEAVLASSEGEEPSAVAAPQHKPGHPS